MRSRREVPHVAFPEGRDRELSPPQVQLGISHRLPAQCPQGRDSMGGAEAPEDEEPGGQGTEGRAEAPEDEEPGG